MTSVFPGPTPAPDDDPPSQDEVDAGMADGGRLAAIERRLIHVDRVTEDTAARVKTIDTQVLSLLVVSICIVAMIYFAAKEVKGLVPPPS